MAQEIVRIKVNKVRKSSKEVNYTARQRSGTRGTTTRGNEENHERKTTEAYGHTYTYLNAAGQCRLPAR